MNTTTLPIINLQRPLLINALAKLPTIGILTSNAEGFTYLKINDDFIHKSFSLLPNKEIIKPDYFSAEKNTIGAHISVIYPEEQKICPAEFLQQPYTFTLDKLFSANLFGKIYYALRIKAPTLNALRCSMGLPEKLSYKNYLIDFHITIGIIPVNKKGA